MTFIEVLVAVVLLGTVAIATMTSLYVSVRGSDQHRSKVNAVSELEGAGAYLARAAWDSDCSTSVADLNAELASGRPGIISENMLIEATSLTCVDGLPRVGLTATSTKGDAIERLEVTLGGISVLNPEASGGPGPGPGCTWGTLSANPQAGVNVHTNGTNDGTLKQGSSISLRLTFSGSCSGPVTATVVGQGPGPSFTATMTQDPLDPLVLNATLTSTYVHWEPDTYVVTVPVGVASTNFVIG